MADCALEEFLRAGGPVRVPRRMCCVVALIERRRDGADGAVACAEIDPDAVRAVLVDPAVMR